MPTPPTILAVDDTPENLVVLGDVLGRDYRVRVASNGARALQIVRGDSPPDLVLLDVMMPDVDGYAVLAAMRADPSTREIPVIFVTAIGSGENEELGLSLGAVDYISKPVKPAIVLARVRTHLELAQARALLRAENRHLEAQVAQRVQELHQIQEATIRALASLAETRDPETGAHILRTQSYVAILAEELRTHPRFRATLDARMIELVAKAAPLHDLGKVGIPDAVLLRPGRLDPAEMAVMRTHAAIGGDALDRALQDQVTHVAPDVRGTELEFLTVARDIARSHHERWDGTGYPDGLAGDRIPIPARLMALADVFDALTTRRVYKAASTIEEAVALIENGRGTHFDPDVVEAFLTQLDAFREVHARLAEPPAGGPG